MNMTQTTITHKITTLGLLATFALSACAPGLADPASQQKNKNDWRNLTIAGAVIAGYGLLKHNQTATILGAAGAAYSASRYEQDRSHQSQDSSARRRYYRSYGWNPTTQSGGRYYDGSNASYQNNGYSQNNGSYQNYGSQNNNNQNYGSQNDPSYQNNCAPQNQGKHLGWSKNGKNSAGRG